jgi:hypothetical protein
MMKMILMMEFEYMMGRKKLVHLDGALDGRKLKLVWIQLGREAVIST